MILALLTDIQTPTSNLPGAPQTHQAELTSFLEAPSAPYEVNCCYLKKT